ncbi:hypothetical protein BC939DRAFT_441225 [Gamsiella multidivaricata]|uniref:uncharacterized protein n=1 Tax=Gamsiella multidivaricata TaxID=101098 RepID=UPI00221FF640|nr:uncharacterized protein BC939DRAFT_441225 [Gamsiella multidivaricata]KAG0357840.1 hypothetical protein BGZ54_000148 [Gamsiella multidivaricata]KAI7829608.1 hypothetical protein BC939DRAFT_441225 [Gamsiella multidivaricata]
MSTVPAFTPAEASAPRFKVHQQSFKFMDQQPVYIQITAMDNSAWVWISAAASPVMQQQSLQPQQQQQGGGGGGGGSFGELAMAMPSSRPGQPAVSSTLLGSPLDETAASMARRLATRFKRQFLVNADIPPGIDNAMLLAFSERKTVEMLQGIFDATPGPVAAAVVDSARVTNGVH